MTATPDQPLREVYVQGYGHCTIDAEGALICLGERVGTVIPGTETARTPRGVMKLESTQVEKRFHWPFLPQFLTAFWWKCEEHSLLLLIPLVGIYAVLVVIFAMLVTLYRATGPVGRAVTAPIRHWHAQRRAHYAAEQERLRNTLRAARGTTRLNREAVVRSPSGGSPTIPDRSPPHGNPQSRESSSPRGVPVLPTAPGRTTTSVFKRPPLGTPPPPPPAGGPRWRGPSDQPS